MNSEETKNKTILTGDRPTGPLHLGHYVGSLKARVEAQEKYNTFVLIADAQALTDNFDNPEKIRSSIREVVLDYLSVGIDPKKANIVLQSQVPELSELTLYYLNLVSLSRLQRNPTIKEEMREKGYNPDLSNGEDGVNVPAGFLMYPVSQAADITAFDADLVPVGGDQSPMLEQTREIVDKFNSIYGKVLKRPEALLAEHARLSGIDGGAKMSKSLNNAIFLKDSPDEVENKVMQMYTDPEHIHKEDPGRVEGNVVFEHLSVFDPDADKVKELKASYQKGGLGDVELKKRLVNVLEEFLAPIREKRQELEKQDGIVEDTLRKGTNEGRKVTSGVLEKTKEAMRLYSL